VANGKVTYRKSGWCGSSRWPLSPNATYNPHARCTKLVQDGHGGRATIICDCKCHDDTPESLAIALPEQRIEANVSSSLHNEEVGVTDTTTEAPVEGAPLASVEDGTAVVITEPTPVDGATAAPADTAPEVTDPEAAAAEPKVRRPKGDLEAQIKEVTDAFVTGQIKLEEGGVLTPHRVAKLIAERNSLEKVPSTGAVSAAFDRWKAYGFAEILDKPKAFVDYTEAGRTEGLSALKAKASEARKAEKKATTE
jgi:hypothetical protein